MAKVTLEDIARECGVTKGLVSRALAGKYNVGDEMRNLIMKKAVELGYDFSRLRAKTKDRASVVLVVSNTILMKEDFWQPILKNLYATLNRDSIRLEYVVFDENHINLAPIKALKDSPCIAFIILHINPDVIFNELAKFKKPIIEVDPKYMHYAGATKVKFSNYSSAYEAVRKLIELGHESIAFYGSDSHAMSFRERHEGFTAAIDDAKRLGVKGVSILFDNKDLQYSDNALLKKTLLEHPEITAIVCANDICALNAQKVLMGMGKRVPDDYSLVGFDNVQAGRVAIPPLTTFDIPREQIGDEIGRYIIRLLQDNRPQFSEITIRCAMIERSSIRAIERKP